MTDKKRPTEHLIWFLQERAKELNCLYRIEELLNKPDAAIEEVCQGIIEAIPPGWQYPDICMAKIVLEEKSYHSAHFEETPWVQSAEIIVQEENVGQVSVYYSKEMPHADDGPFLKEETKLLETIADRIGHFIMYNRMKMVFHEFTESDEEIAEEKVEEWLVAFKLLRQTDHNLFRTISRRMLNLLCWSGIEEGEELLARSIGMGNVSDEEIGDDNRPYQKNVLIFSDVLGEEIFKIAAKHLTGEQILSNIQKWIQEERMSFLVRVTNRNLPLTNVVDAIRRYHHIAVEGAELPATSKRGVMASLVRRFFSDQPNYIKTALEFMDLNDFYDLVDHIVFPVESHGKLGGKSAGLFLADRIIKKSVETFPRLGTVKVPRTWYITSDGFLSFLSHNGLNEVVEQKYKDIDQVRLEYPHIVQNLKNAPFPTEIIQGLSMVLDDFEGSPLIVRSSSLLEDRTGASFSGKYKSLFLANQGSKQERLEALTDAIAEVYASTYGPDPISYRAERDLLDFGEEMGIMIQEVVGRRVGDYFIPAYAGVAFSRNEFRWSPRIKKEDGLIRIVPGLGTRAVDRTSDDYPILIAPGQSTLRVNVTIDETIRYAPKKIDVINLKTNSFETMDFSDLMRLSGHEFPRIDKVVSIFDGQQIRKPIGKAIDFEKDVLVVTFDGLIRDTRFIDQVKSILEILEINLKTPVDIEFASDGKDFYLLQCRPQSYMEGCSPVPIPREVQKEKIVFSAHRYISNGKIPDITHIVYVDPQKYDQLSDQLSMIAVGRAIGKLNKLLPKRKFILMGPGRWGSRGDIKLGVRVTYADISNTALLIEIARKKGNYLPDLSFGTHFFQDLVEAEIRYIPLYPDDGDTIFNEAFLRTANNILPRILPEFDSLSDVIQVIDVAENTGGSILRILMNADLDEAVGLFTEPSPEIRQQEALRHIDERQTENYWAWRMKMAEQIALQLDPERFGVQGFYLFGSTKNATAGPTSDIDLLIHFRGSERQKEELMLWLEGWSLSISEMNYLRTGYRTTGLLDVHFVTDDDIARKTSYAVKIGAITDPAMLLPMMKKDL